MLPSTNRILFVLFVQLEVLSRISCKPIDSVLPSPWDENSVKSRIFRTKKPLVRTAGDPDNWLTPKPITWKPWTQRPIPWEPWTPRRIPWEPWTPRPIPWTLKPITWNFVLPTWKPIHWTIPPFDIGTKKYKKEDTMVKVLIFVPTVLFSLVLLFCKSYMCKKDQNNTGAPQLIIHPPSSPETTPPENRVSRSSQYRIYRNETQNTDSSSRTSPWTTYNSSINQDAGASGINNVRDKPPGYFEVVLSDMIGEYPKFPDVSPSPPDLPPPKYDECMERY